MSAFAEFKQLRKIENGSWILGVLFFCLARLAVLEYHLVARLESFYYFRGDDVSRLIAAVDWAKRPDFRPTPDWLPLPCYLIGLVIKFFGHPQSAASHLHIAFTTATLAFIGLTALKLFPEKPAASLIAMTGVQFLPTLQRLSLSPSSEAEMWLFLTAAVFFWTRYLLGGGRYAAWLTAGSLFLASMTRYEAWLFLVPFFVFAARAFHERREPSWVLRRYALILFGYVVFFILYQENSLGHFREHSESFVLPLSYRGIRLHFRAPVAEGVDIVRSYHKPLTMFLGILPALSLPGLAGAAVALRRKSTAAWLAILWASALLLFCFVAGFFGASLDSERLIVVFYLLIAPFFGWAYATLLPAAAASLPVIGAAALLSLRFLPAQLPQHLSLLSMDIPGTTVFAKAIFFSDRARGPGPKILFELFEGGDEAYAENPLQFAAFDRVILDRRLIRSAADNILQTRDNPSVFQGSREELRRYLRDRGIGLIVTHTPGAADKLRGAAQPIDTVGSVTLYGYELSPADIEAYRSHIRRILSTLPPNGRFYRPL